ncbi:MAG: class I SAM-dependent methyltransferase [Bacteroidota bacterium]
MKNQNSWYQQWFNTPYYHKLYDHRNDEEAEIFMNKLIGFLKLPEKGKILDLPCGRGRHAIYLNNLGYRITGADLSINNINYAKKFENNTLHFHTHDMRNHLKEKYDAIFNLFTSFGYFDDEDENVKVLQNFKSGLKDNGIIVLDFLNISKAKTNLIPKEIITKNNIDFYIKRKVENNYLKKVIEFNTDDKLFEFEEKVQCLTLPKFKSMSKKANLKIKHIFGDYKLMPFDEKESDRLILIFQ